jgi:hypothetical protein
MKRLLSLLTTITLLMNTLSLLAVPELNLEFT